MIGVILSLFSFIIFILLEIARISGVFTNQFFGLLTYLIFPSAFILGFIFIAIGWKFYKRKNGLTTAEIIKKRFDADDLLARKQGSKLFLTILVLSFITIIFLGAAGYRTLHFMDQPVFCGTACHTVMNPEWVTYQNSPHAHVPCVECHVGEGLDALIASKYEGARQMFLATFNIYHRPIPTPVHQLRPARETCEKCHWPQKFYGNLLKSYVNYKSDRKNTKTYTTLSLKIDTNQTGKRAGIHWHIASDNKVRYASINDKREQILWVEVKRKDGTFKRFRNTEQFSSTETSNSKKIRTLDCVDCHNRATHIYENPSQEIDNRLQNGELDSSLPFLKREGLHAITFGYPSYDAALHGIKNHIEGFYRKFKQNKQSIDSVKIDKTIEILQNIYLRNIHPYMKIEWNTYSSHLGHPNGDKTGCLRCHNQQMVSDDGSEIKHNCTLCHSILADHSNEPFKYLKPADYNNRNYNMHIFLQNEFTNSFNK